MYTVDDEDLLFLDVQQMAKRAGDDGLVPGLSPTQSAFIFQAARNGLRTLVEVRYAEDCLRDYITRPKKRNPLDRIAKMCYVD